MASFDSDVSNASARLRGATLAAAVAAALFTLIAGASDACAAGSIADDDRPSISDRGRPSTASSSKPSPARDPLDPAFSVPTPPSAPSLGGVRSSAEHRQSGSIAGQGRSLSRDAQKNAAESLHTIVIRGRDENGLAERRYVIPRDIMNPQPIFNNDIVRYDSNGAPVTRLQDEGIKLAREFAKAIEQEEADRRARGENVPVRKKRDIWAERQAEIDARIAREGEPVTKNFTIPGTTPEESAAIHSERGGGMIVNGELVWRVKDEGGRSETTIRIETEEPPATAQAEPQATLEGVEEGFSADDLREAFTLERMKKDPFIVQELFKDVDRQRMSEEGVEGKCDDCTAPADAVKPQNTSFLEDVFALLTGSRTAHAAAPLTREELEVIAKISKEGKDLSENADVEAALEFLPEENEAFQAEAMRLVEETAKARYYARKGTIPEMDRALEKVAKEEERLREEAAAANEVRDTYIFVSHSLGDDGLRNILGYASEHPNVELVFRGFPEGTNISTGFAHLRDLIREFETTPNIIVDPALFRAYDVKAVPTVVRVSDEELQLRPRAQLLPEVEALLTPEEKEARAASEARDREAFESGAYDLVSGRLVPKFIAKVEGLDNARWLNDQIRRGHAGDFGNKGYIYPIWEPDLIAEMQRRALTIDWEAKKERAMENYWVEAAKEHKALPTTLVSSVRTMDPTVVFTRDVTDTDGNVLFHAGDFVNPLKHREFDLAVVIFNPGDARELDVLKERREEIANRPGVNRIVWLVTEIDPKRGWDAYEEACNFADAPVFFLTPEIRTRWDVRRTPTVITADAEKKIFLVEELGPKGSEDPSENEIPSKEGGEK